MFHFKVRKCTEIVANSNILLNSCRAKFCISFEECGNLVGSVTLRNKTHKKTEANIHKSPESYFRLVQHSKNPNLISAYSVFAIFVFSYRGNQK